MTHDPIENAAFRRSPLLSAAGFRHAFFTRHGGVSTGAYATLNFSSANGDSPENVAANLARAAKALSVEPKDIYFASQVHGREVLVIEGSRSREEVLYLEADAILSSQANVACGVRSADCVPILLADRASGAAAAVHAGWRGVAAGIIPAAVRVLSASSGEASELIAAIGPHISLRAFEVSENVAQELLESSPDPHVVSRSFGPKPHIDLRRIVRAQLLSAGLSAGAIDDVVGCTFSEEGEFFSYRRDGKCSGRHLSAIVPRDARASSSDLEVS